VPRRLATRVTNLGVMVCTGTVEENLFTTYTDQVIAGVHQYCSEAGLGLMILARTLEQLAAADPVTELYRRGINGVIVLNASTESGFLGSFEQEPVPYCCVISGHAKYPERILTVDNRMLAGRAVDHLVHLGHRRIGFICGNPQLAAHQDRRAGYQAAMERAGLPPLEVWEPAPTGVEIGFATTRELLARHPDTTAIFTTGDDLADGVRGALHGLRLRIPDDLSLIGCDDSARARYFGPPLTVIDIPNNKLGELAARWVHAQIADISAPHPPHEPWMEGRLILRESTAPPRQ
jgi:LacI family transcriptional regulator